MGGMQSGPDALTQWMARRSVNQRQAADIIGIDFTMLNHYICGRRSPSLDTAVLIEEKTGIPVKAWVSTSSDTSDVAVPATSNRIK